MRLTAALLQLLADCVEVAGLVPAPVVVVVEGGVDAEAGVDLVEQAAAAWPPADIAPSGRPTR